MRETLGVLEELTSKGLVRDYALGGGVAALFYVEPFLTYDLDAFVLLPAEDQAIVSLSPLYDYLLGAGHTADGEHVVIHGVPVQLIPAYNPLVEEAVAQAVEADYEGVKTRVVKAEHLVAIMLQTGRPKDLLRISMFLDLGVLDTDLLEDILARHQLAGKWEKLKGRLHGE